VAAGKRLEPGFAQAAAKGFDGDVDVRQGFAIVRIRLWTMPAAQDEPAEPLDLCVGADFGGEGGEGAGVVDPEDDVLAEASRSWRARRQATPRRRSCR